MTPKHSVLKQPTFTFVFPDCSGSGVWAQINWILWFWIYHHTDTKVSVSATFMLNPLEMNHFQAHSHSCW